MCRFIAYLGNTPIILKELIDTPCYSLIKQSRQTCEGKPGINADGFGIGWYDRDIDSDPGIFKSIQPAWNDQNLKHMAAKIRSRCFVGHIRASTIGEVNTINCHPFAYRQFLFAHNGTICGFDKIKRPLVNLLNDDIALSLKGQTDSEHFFALLMNNLPPQHTDIALNDIVKAMQLAIDQITALQAEFSDVCSSKINGVLTDGQRIIATRYISSTDQKALSLHYAIGDHIDCGRTQHQVIHTETNTPGAVIIASEPLTDYADEWHEVPGNHILTVDETLKISLHPIPS